MSLERAGSLFLGHGAPEFAERVPPEQILVRVPAAVAVGIDVVRRLGLAAVGGCRPHGTPGCLSAVVGRGRDQAGVVVVGEAP